MEKILLADDDRMMGESLRGVLVGMGYEVVLVRDGQAALAKYDRVRPDLVLLDVMMPKRNGFEVCEDIRANDPDVPIIFLTGKDSEADQIHGLGIGADDYISKDAGPALLLARIARVLKRTSPLKSHDSRTTMESVFRIGDARIDVNLLTVSVGGNVTTRLTRTEYEILSILVKGRGVAHSSAEIICQLRGDGFVCEEGMVYVHMSNLRRKLGRIGKLIKRVPSAGYMVE